MVVWPIGRNDEMGGVMCVESVLLRQPKARSVYAQSFRKIQNNTTHVFIAPPSITLTVLLPFVHRLCTYRR